MIKVMESPKKPNTSSEHCFPVAGNLSRLMAAGALLAVGGNVAACYHDDPQPATESSTAIAESSVTYTDDLVPPDQWQKDPGHPSLRWTCLSSTEKVQVDLSGQRQNGPEAFVGEDPLNCSAPDNRSVTWYPGPEGQQQACLNEVFLVSVDPNNIDPAGQPQATVTKVNDCPLS